MTDKYTLQADYAKGRARYAFGLYEHGQLIAAIDCDEQTALLLDKCLNQTSRAGSKTSQAKRDASKRNIAKRWKK